MRHLIIPLFIPHRGCPHRCVFCNQDAMTGVLKAVGPAEIKGYVNAYLSLISGPLSPHAAPGLVRSGEPGEVAARRRELAFYGGSFTGLPENLMRGYLQAARELMEGGVIDSVRLSTRPDYISPQTASLLRSFGAQTVELGVQSLSDSVLEASGRGHTSEDSIRSISLLKKCGFHVVAQLMTGLPGAAPADDLETVERLIPLRPHSARIYPTLVMRGTELERLYRSGAYTPPPLEESVELCGTMTERLEENGIRVIRLGVQQTAEMAEGGAIVAGPFHPSLGGMVRARIAYRRVSSELDRFDTAGAEMDLEVHRSEVSTYRGFKNSNLASWKERHKLGRINMIPSKAVGLGGFRATLKGGCNGRTIASRLRRCSG